MSGAPTVGDEPWGIQELAAWLGVKPATISQQRWRGKLPQPVDTMSGSPYWWKSEITARLPVHAAASHE